MSAKEDGHGSLSTYNNHKCRCVLCRQAARVYKRGYREKYRGIPRIDTEPSLRAYDIEEDE